MYLAELTIEGFRRIKSLALTFRPGLNVIVGPNNVGKTAIVDALRALLSTTEEGALRITDLDLHLAMDGKKAEHIAFKYVFRDLSVTEEADFLPALKPDVSGTKYEAHLTVRYAPSSSSGRLRPKRWCGDHEENSVSAEMLEDLRGIYLPPLRDPASGLRPSRSSQIARLIDRLSNPQQKEELVRTLAEFDAQLKGLAPVAGTEQAIKERHEEMLGKTLSQSLGVGLTAHDFQRLAARLALIVDSLDVEQNGLGYNNLIYMAVVLSELSVSPDAAYRALLVEEPEAHLHPQMQAVLLDYLQSSQRSQSSAAVGHQVQKVGVAASTVENKGGSEKSPMSSSSSESVQVFVSSHSPNFASLADIDSIICTCVNDNAVLAFAPRDVKFESSSTKEKLQRYLDVTRADLFFARRIILVEGTAERFIVAALASTLKIDLKRHAVSILSTEGLNFDAFGPLFGPQQLNVRVAIISDSDPSDPVSYPTLGSPLSLSSTALTIKKLSNTFVKAFFSQKTLEYDLALRPENHEAMLSALTEIHPGIGADLKAAASSAAADDKARVIFSGMFERPGTTKNVQKGAYAQALAHLVTHKGATLLSPAYIEEALRYVVAD